VEENYGHLEIRLAELIEKKGLNRNKVSLKAAMNWRQVDRYCENDITRLDTFVLCKLCTALECEIQDLLVFVPEEKEQGK
jgi:putative transcriptional regulator